ncbi:uncharacterized protein BX664DRAFT_381692 [Halteromyces radiatus]|uniref:uncharacterized protein n=1 Tax=Halteromyces radiatus TaxID=101107 RepID=UPI00221F350E|nr:uncharacterized protein BX664DRAFT_381692 [Halteromyces radiatus]KAI8099080.1 hypothetical protein BX664DRAFT_381692 [Halteromyces radiatus]
MKAVTVVNSNTTKPRNSGIFPLEENQSPSAGIINSDASTLPIDVFNSGSSFPNSNESIDANTCWNMRDDLDLSTLLDPSLWSIDSSDQRFSDPLADLAKNSHHPLSQQSQPPEQQQEQSWISHIQQLPPTPSCSLPSTRTQSPLMNGGQPYHQDSSFLPPTPPVDNQPAFGVHAPVPSLPTQHHPSSGAMMMTSPFDPQASLSSHSASPLVINTNNNGNRTHFHNNKMYQRRRSDQQPYRKNNSSNVPSVRRRAASVASVVSLTAHEPIAHMINGIEHITFLYSHDRLIKEYTVRTDVDNLDIDDVPMDFRLQNAIYPRANVEKEEYDGNRWNYETSCNQLGWKLCWLNREQLFGKRGLIQRAVDSYRNRHTELRSRRVTRQEKLANGTLRKRRAKKLTNSYF